MLSTSTEAQRSQIDLKKLYLHPRRSCAATSGGVHDNALILAAKSEDLTLKRGLNNVFSNQFWFSGLP